MGKNRTNEIPSQWEFVEKYIRLNNAELFTFLCFWFACHYFCIIHFNSRIKAHVPQYFAWWFFYSSANRSLYRFSILSGGCEDGMYSKYAWYCLSFAHVNWSIGCWMGVKETEWDRERDGEKVNIIKRQLNLNCDLPFFKWTFVVEQLNILMLLSVSGFCLHSGLIYINFRWHSIH